MKKHQIPKIRIERKQPPFGMPSQVQNREIIDTRGETGYGQYIMVTR